jgi:transcriptional regulator GlxA family with amidase domain
VTSVCTGALLLARAGLLAGRRATTHWGALALLGELDPTTRVEPHPRVVDDGIVTSAGVSAGIDMALAIVEAMHGRAVADETARYMDYVRQDR